MKIVRDKKSLIHNITNLVAMNYAANSLLSMGVSPVMAHAENSEIRRFFKGTGEDQSNTAA